MFDEINLNNILFLDIETVPVAKDFSELEPTFQKLWEEKTVFQRKEESADQYFSKKAGVMAEFAKIICISVGYIYRKGDVPIFRLKSFYGHNEKNLLKDFNLLLDENFQQQKHYLCAHNGKEFDYPFLCRRMLINGVKLPKILQIAGKKPWEIKHLDTMELWKFGDYKHYTSIKLLAALFNIPTPKDDIDGSQVSSVYWHENDLERIKTYCQKDTLTVAQLFLKYKGEELLTEAQIEVA